MLRSFRTWLLKEPAAEEEPAEPESMEMPADIEPQSDDTEEKKKDADKV